MSLRPWRARPWPLLSALAVFLHIFAQASEATGSEQQRCSKDNPCENNGTCHTLAGICACPPGYGGPLCAVTLLPACRYTTEVKLGMAPAMHCRAWSVKSCACFDQCMKYNLAVFPDLTWPCFERKGVAPEDELSVLPAADDPTAIYYHDWRKRKPDTVQTREQYLNTPHSEFPQMPTELSRCPEMCNGNGMCLEQPGGNPYCMCLYGYIGLTCDFARPRTCPNECSGHGKCMRGFCSCDSGYWGMDCGVDLTDPKFAAIDEHIVMPDPFSFADPPDAALVARRASELSNRTRLPSPVRMRIYVYDLPPWLYVPQYADGWDFPQGNDAGHNGMYTADMQFENRLLRDWSVRTLDPFEANLFYIPAWNYGWTSNGGDPNLNAERLREFLLRFYPTFWNEFDGGNHIIAALGLTNMTLVDPAQTGSCFDGNRGVVIVPYHDEGVSMANAAYHGESHHSERKYLLSFAGSLALDIVDISHFYYGVRQRVYKLFHDHPRFKVEIQSSDMLADIRNSVFCLTPSGWGWGYRLVFDMLGGCIPVIIQDGIHQPGDDVLPYEQFSVRLPERDVDDLKELLEGMTPLEVRTLQQGVHKFHKYFYWQDDGEAYDLTIKSLTAKWYNLESVFRRRLGVTAAGSSSIEEGGDIGEAPLQLRDDAAAARRRPGKFVAGRFRGS